MYREVHEQGFGGARQSVRRWLSVRRHLPTHMVGQRGVRATPKVLAWLLENEASVQEPEREALRVLKASFPEVEQLAALGKTFRSALLRHDVDALQAWREAVQASDLTHLKAFAGGLDWEWEALEAACRLDWSNGPTEGAVNRIKLIKRQMYGRGSTDGGLSTRSANASCWLPESFP
ncbi:transposase [Deinococcus peraridilitoris]|uniref:transposase n=1 Tax=Deinococcus peraridilitoris TaxID=432329 RepID=UPI0002EC21DF|nr:transposase [Deinococcus peraridilitoris]